MTDSILKHEAFYILPLYEENLSLPKSWNLFSYFAHITCVTKKEMISEEKSFPQYFIFFLPFANLLIITKEPFKSSVSIFTEWKLITSQQRRKNLSEEFEIRFLIFRCNKLDVSCYKVLCYTIKRKRVFEKVCIYLKANK